MMEPRYAYLVHGAKEGLGLSTKSNGSVGLEDRFFALSIDMLCMAGFDGYFKQLSPSFERTLGWTKEELMNKPFIELVHPDHRQATSLTFASLRNGNDLFHFENLFQCKDGSFKWISWSAYPVMDESLIYAIGRDTTKRKETEAALRAGERKYRNLLEVATEGVLVIDANATITYVNERLLGMLDYELDEVVGQPLARFVDAPDVPCLLKHLGQRKRGVEEQYDLKLVRKDGRMILTTISASPMFDDERRYCGSMSLVTDVTERRKMEAALKEEKERLSVTLRSIGDGVIVTDDDGRVALMNDVAEQLTGWKQVEALSRPLEDVFNIINEETRARCENPAEKVLRLGKVVGLANHTILISRDGTERMLGDSGAPIKDENGKIMGVVLVFRDVTKERRMEAEMENIQRLESVGVLAGGIAHDFNNYLTAIEGNIVLAKMKMDPSNTAALERLSDAEKASIKARSLTKQLLVFSKGGEPVKKIINVERLLSESSRLTLAGSNVQCRLAVDAGLWTVEADEGQIGQAINNILINARDAMPQGGVIDICVKNVMSGLEETSLSGDGEYISISIRDQGAGIPSKDLDRIFDPYFTTKPNGRGLGLAIVHSIVKHHSGNVLAHSVLNEGTTFTIFLPVTNVTIKLEDEEKKTIVSGHGRLLWMDDEQMIREVGEDILSYLGYDAEFAKDGEEAIEKYLLMKQTNEHFDLVILDLTIPGGMGGEETMRRLLEIDPAIKAIVCSGYSNDPVMSHYLDYGFKGVIPKPFSIEDLSDTIRGVIGKESNDG